MRQLVVTLGELGLGVLARQLDVQVHGGPLAAEHGVRHVGRAVAVGVTNGPHASDVGTLALRDNDLVVADVEVHLGRQVGELNGREVGDESAAGDRLALGEVHAELVELLGGGPVLATILDTLDRRDGAVLNLDVPGLELLLPALVLGSGRGLALRGLGAVHKGDNVGELGVGLEDTAESVGDVANDSQGLVPVLVAVAPGAPEDTLTPSFAQARGLGEHILQASTQDNLARSVLLAGAVGHGKRGEGVVALGHDGGDSRVLERGGVILGDLLASEATELSRGRA